MQMANFTKQDIPYDILGDFGLTKQMINDLPESVMNRLLTGRQTPPLPVRDKTQDGNICHALAKISLVRKEDGNMDVMFYPRMEILDLKEFPNIPANTIRSGKVIRTDKGYMQYNSKIEQIMQVPYGIILHNVETITDELGLSNKERDNLLKAKPVTIENGEYKGCTIGIDLENERAVRLSKGTVIDWEKEENIDNIRKYNFGIFGCWIMDEKNTLQYLRSSEYESRPDVMDALEEMVKQQQKIK